MKLKKITKEKITKSPALEKRWYEDACGSALGLELLGERLSNKDIAARLYLSPRTVEKHVASLLLKTGAADRAALGRLGRQR